MRNETKERIQRIRSRVLTGRASLSDLKTQLAANTDKYLNWLLQQTSNWLDDVEVLFLAILEDGRTPPRPAAEESRALDYAEFFLERFAMAQLEAVQEMVAKFGPSVRSMG
jgi:hypothetical protein